MARVFLVIGTRPEAIKLAPVLRALSASGRFEPTVISSGQHREMLGQAFRLLGFSPDQDLAVMSDRQELTDLAARLVGDLGRAMRRTRPDAVLVQGDTTTCFCAALAAFYEGIPVGHVEAGLRSGAMDNPFPEEANRVMVSRLARWHFAPTRRAWENLRAEGVSEESIEITGNTVVDSLLWIRSKGLGLSGFTPGPHRKVLVTLHRRESHGEILRGLGWAVARLADRPDVEVVLPLHRSPAVREALLPVLADHARVRIVEPLDYADFIATLVNCDVVLTDSGGVQEEASTVGKPVLVLRETTERPEAVEAGTTKLVGVEPARVLCEALGVLDNPDRHTGIAAGMNPFGDGDASRRIVDRLTADLLGRGAGDSCSSVQEMLNS
jgi:UDP-N-acetylglucosamine 2-epimerase (non-hydrolysing)